MNHSRLSLLLALVALTGAAQAADTVPLQIELPKPLFAGTPRPIALPNLEKPRTGKRPDLMVPNGTVNLSKGKTVTSSDSLPVIGELTFINDGDKSGTTAPTSSSGRPLNGSKSTSAHPPKSPPSPSGTSTPKPASTTTSSSKSPMTPPSRPASPRSSTTTTTTPPSSAKVKTKPTSKTTRANSSTAKAPTAATSASPATATPPTSSTTTAKSKFTVHS